MIQFNLLPDVKQEYLKAKRLKHTVIIVSLLTAAASLFIFTMLFLTVWLFQKGQIRNLNNQISESSKTLRETKDLDKILTIQNQLDSLPALHDGKPVTSRLFAYINQIIPDKVSVGKLETNFDESTIQIEGSGEALSDINKFIDSIKFTTYVSEENPPKDPNDPPKAFSNVVLTEFTVDGPTTTYQINLSFNKDIFDNNQKITLTVPKRTTTRSATEKPDLFKALPEKQQ